MDKQTEAIFYSKCSASQRLSLNTVKKVCHSVSYCGFYSNVPSIALAREKLLSPDQVNLFTEFCTGKYLSWLKFYCKEGVDQIVI